MSRVCGRGVLARLWLLVVLTAPAAAFVPVAPAAAQSQRVDPADVEDEVQCVQCGRPLATSSGTAADDQRQLIADLAAQGLTKEQIKDRLVDEYGRRVLLEDSSPIAAAAPWAAGAIGIASVGLLLLRRGRRSGPADAPTAAGGVDEPQSTLPAPTAGDEARIDAELDALDER